ncbi:hypothetical protein [Frankia tisae]|uniref:hypothetical protein n=1 Tax=Frankia tisae TaxID=2950104 RepID=UPI0021BF4219|nr:hypothetical protein [Frankia tisae]
MHTLGAADVGVDSQERNRLRKAGKDRGPGIPERLDELRKAVTSGDSELVISLLGTPAPLFRDVPLRTVLRTVSAQDRLLLVATDSTATGRPHEEDTFGLAEQIREALTVVPDLFGKRLTAEQVHIVVAGRPATKAGMEAASDWLTDHRDADKLVVGVGSGSTNLAIGALLAALADGRPVEIRPVQPGEQNAEVALQVPADPRPWLARRRMFGALASQIPEKDKATRKILELLDARQRLDVPRFEALAAELSDTLGVPVDGRLDPRKVPVGLDGAFFDRLTRREVQAAMIGRSWLVQEYAWRSGPDDPPYDDPSERADPGKSETLGNFLRRADRYRHRSEAIQFLLDQTWINDIGRDGTHLLARPKPRDSELAAPIAAVADSRDPRVDFLAGLGELPGFGPAHELLAAPSAASNEVLIVYCVGGREEDAGRRPFVEALLEPATIEKITNVVYPVVEPRDNPHRRGDQTPFRARLRFHLVATAQTAEPAKRSAAVISQQISALDHAGERAAPVDDPAALEPVIVPETIAGVRAEVVRSFGELPGRAALDAIVVFTGPGRMDMNVGLLLAASQLAAEVGCPVYVGALVMRDGATSGATSTETEVFPDQVATLPGYPGLLARVALGHLVDLELGAAAETLRRGGLLLRGLAERAAAIESAFTGERAPDLAASTDVARRIELVKVLALEPELSVPGQGHWTREVRWMGRVRKLAGRSVVDQWHAVCLAMAVADRVLDTEWKKQPRRRFSGAAYELRNRSVTAHGDRPEPFQAVLEEVQVQRQVPRRVGSCWELLNAVQNELDPNTDRALWRSLRADYQELVRDVAGYADARYAEQLDETPPAAEY